MGLDYKAICLKLRKLTENVRYNAETRLNDPAVRVHKIVLHIKHHPQLLSDTNI